MSTAWSGVTAPGATTLTGPSTSPPCGGDHRGRRFLDVEQRHRRVGPQVDRHDGQPQEAAERAGHVWSEHGREPQQRDRHIGETAGALGQLLDRDQRAAERRRRVDRHGFIGPRGGPSAPAVHLDPGPHDDRLDRPALGRRAQHVHCPGPGARGGAGRPRPGVGLVDAEVHDDMGVERRHELDRATAVPWIDPLEARPAQPAAGRVDVDAPTRSPTQA